MNLGIVLAIGESLKDFAKHGQDKLLIDQYIKNYKKSFEKVFVFSYENETFFLPKGVYLVQNEKKLHRYLYSPLLPFIKANYFRNCDVLRGLQITGGIPCVIVKLFLGKPFVVNYGYDYVDFARIEGKLIHSWFYKIVIYIVLKTADAVIVTTPALKKSIKTIRKKDVFVIPNSVDTKLFSPKKNQKKKNNVKLIYVGRLEPQKNLKSLLKAISTLERVSLTIVGQGSQGRLLKNYAKRQKIKVDFKTILPHSKLPSLLAKHDIFVLPSLKEGHPKALLEAMSMGLPCIGTNCEGIKDIIDNRHNGILTTPDPLSIKNAIRKLANNEKRAKEIGLNARKSILAKYEAEILIQREINLFKKVANGKKNIVSL